MIASLKTFEAHRTMADLLHELGDIPPTRVRLKPYPGTATVKDTERNKLCELIDGVLVEKPVGQREALLASYLIQILGAFVHARKLGKVYGSDATLQIMPKLVRLPDVSFVSWDNFPGRRIPKEAVPHLAPDLAIEVLSDGNTKAEMTRKVREYFEANVRLVWLVDPKKKTLTQYWSARDKIILKEGDTVDGGDVLPGFSLPLAELFAELDERG